MASRRNAKNLWIEIPSDTNDEEHQGFWPEVDHGEAASQQDYGYDYLHSFAETTPQSGAVLPRSGSHSDGPRGRGGAAPRSGRDRPTFSKFDKKAAPKTGRDRPVYSRFDGKTPKFHQPGPPGPPLLPGGAIACAPSEVVEGVSPMSLVAETTPLARSSSGGGATAGAFWPCAAGAAGAAKGSSQDGGMMHQGCMIPTMPPGAIITYPTGRVVVTNKGAPPFKKPTRAKSAKTSPGGTPAHGPNRPVYRVRETEFETRFKRAVDENGVPLGKGGYAVTK